MSDNEQNQVELDEFLSEDDTAPMSEGEMEEATGYAILDGGRERLAIDGIFTSQRVNDKFKHKEMSVRVQFAVSPNALINPPGRKASVFLTFPSKAARSSAANLMTQFNISKNTLTQILLAALGGKSAKEPGEYPIVEDAEGNPAFVNALDFVLRPEYQALVKGHEFTADVAVVTSYKNKKTGQIVQLPKARNEFDNFKPIVTGGSDEVGFDDEVA